DLADEVGDRRVRRGQLLAEAMVAGDPLDRSVVAVLPNQIARVLRHRAVRVVVDLRPGDDRKPLVEQIGKRTDDSGLGLAPFAQEDDVVASEEGVLQLWENGVLVTEDPVNQWL